MSLVARGLGRTAHAIVPTFGLGRSASQDPGAPTYGGGGSAARTQRLHDDDELLLLMFAQAIVATW